MDNEDFYKRKFASADADEAWYDDNADRAYLLLQKRAGDGEEFGWPPHLIHCHGWMASLLPLYLKTAYKKERCSPTAR
jgi:starch synthase